MSEIGEKHLRGIILSYQTWMERQVALGLLDIENTPDCFDRSKQSLKEMIDNDKSIGQSCHFCNKDFRPDEIKTTDNRIMWFHADCKPKFDKAEEDALNRQDRY